MTAWLTVWTMAACAGVQASPPPIEHVVMVSVDGLRADALTTLKRTALPSFHRLLADAGTLEARCDPTLSLTLPNHTSMLTGLPVAAHQWTYNGTPAPEVTFHNHRGRYLASAFDVAHDHGVKTALLAGKEKFVLMDRSWDERDGAVDTHLENNGRDKIDRFVMDLDAAVLTKALLTTLQEDNVRSLTLIHYRQPDGAGHGFGWDMSPASPYLASIVAVDRQLARVFAFLDARPALKRKTAILLTSDHGGGKPFRSHVYPQEVEVYRIPFLAWVGGHGQRGDLYQWSQGARDVGTGNPLIDAGIPPIRNGEIGNAALSLLGLPAVSGSTLNHRQDLILRPSDLPPAKPSR
jgi:predicted AlkP superfamily pyrophosphatase or phosphodiesterase